MYVCSDKFKKTAVVPTLIFLLFLVMPMASADCITPSVNETLSDLKNETNVSMEPVVEHLCSRDSAFADASRNYVDDELDKFENQRNESLQELEEELRKDILEYMESRDELAASLDRVANVTNRSITLEDRVEEDIKALEEKIEDVDNKYMPRHEVQGELDDIRNEVVSEGLKEQSGVSSRFTMFILIAGGIFVIWLLWTRTSVLDDVKGKTGDGRELSEAERKKLQSGMNDGPEDVEYEENGTN